MFHFSVFLAVLLCAVSARAVPLQLWVAPSGSDTASGTVEAPFASPARARDEIRRQKPRDGALVILRGGTYRLGETLTFGAQDGGTSENAPVVYRAAPGENPVLDGGQPLTDWKAAGDRRWTHDLARPVRQLWAQAYPLPMARWPGGDLLARLFDEDSQSVQLPPDGLEWLRDEANWRDLIVRVDAHFAPMMLSVFDVETARNGDLRLIPPPRQRARMMDFVLKHSAHRAPYRSPVWFEGAPSLLGKPGGSGTWACETTPGGARLLFASNRVPVQVVAPRLETLVRIVGEEQPVQHLRFEGLSFQHAGWNGAREGFISMQAMVEWGNKAEQSRRISGAVEIENARAVAFSGCLFRENGTQGIVFKSATNGCRIENNRFIDLSGGAVVIESLDLQRPSQNDVVAGNFIRRIGLEFEGQTAIFGGYCQNLTVQNNDIADCPYTGISLGWGWTQPSGVAQNNLVNGNRIARVVTRLDDGAGIYLLGSQPGTRVENNELRDIVRPDRSPTRPMPASAIYLDEGSQGVTVQLNRIVRCPQPFHFNRNGENNRVTNNTVNGALVADSLAH